MLVARYAANDAYASEIADAQRLVGGCDACAALAADITLIASRTGSLPDVRRTRDFRITVQQADELRGSWLERVLRRFSAPGWGVLRPVAGAALAIGLVLVVVGALPLGSATQPVEDAAAGATQSQSGGFVAFGSLPAVEAAPSQASADSGSGVATAATTAVAASTAAAAAPSQVASAPEIGVISPTPIPAKGTDTSSSGPEASVGNPQPAASRAATLPSGSIRSSAPEATPELGNIVPPAAAPSTPPPPGPVVAVTAQNALDRSWLIVAGLVIAFLALIALGLLWVARRRYEDPLTR